MATNLVIHDMRHGERFDPDGLYVHDSGACFCGEHVGTEATYQAQAWSCLGRGPEIEIDGVTFRCEIPHRV